MRSYDLLDLLRIGNVFTALADISAAAAVAGVVDDTALRPIPFAATLLASAALYCGGMVLNDVADTETDRRERPGRPIPSGRVRRSTAAVIASGLLVAGPLLARLAGDGPFMVALLLLLAILVYDFALAGRALLGPLGMALCRGLNWWMGLLAAGAVGAVGAFSTGVIFVYVLGLTHLSLGEATGSRRDAVILSILSTLAAVLGVLLLARTGRSPWWPGAVPSILVLLLLLLRVSPALAGALRRPAASTTAAAVGVLVSSITLLDAAIASALNRALWLLPFALYALLQELLRRRYRVT